MATAKTATNKNRPPNYRERFLNGKPVVPVLYGGKYMTGSVDGQLIMKNGVPAPLRQIGELVRV